MKEGFLADVYDGNLWKQFQVTNGTSFPERARTYGFMLNCRELKDSSGKISLSLVLFLHLIENLKT